MTIIKKRGSWTLDLLELPGGKTLVRTYHEPDEFHPACLVGEPVELDQAGSRALLAAVALADRIWLGRCGHPLCECARSTSR